MPTRVRGLRGFTLIELLVVISIIALLVSILLPSLTAARQEGIRLKCQANVRSVNGYAQNNAISEPRGIAHAMAKSGEMYWRGLGAWDFGGSDGRCGEMRSDYGQLDASLGARYRPFNAAVAGPDFDVTMQFKEYQCPGDTGYAPIRNYRPGFVDDSPCTGDEVEEVQNGPMWKERGTSYQGDFVWFGGPNDLGQPTALRYGSFMRPVSMVPNASETLLFYEGRFAQAFFSTAECAAVNGGTPIDVAGWHGKMCEFNAVMMDGHAQRITLHNRGDMVDIVSKIDPVQYPYRAGMFRGVGWRYDAFPARFVVEHRTGNP